MQFTQNKQKRNTRKHDEIQACNIIILLILFDESNSGDWLDLNHQQSFNDISLKVHIVDPSNSKIGKNLLMNRLSFINDQIEYDWLSLSNDGFKP